MAETALVEPVFPLATSQTEQGVVAPTPERVVPSRHPEPTDADDNLDEAHIRRNQDDVRARYQRALQGLDDDTSQQDPPVEGPLGREELTATPPPPLGTERSIISRIGADALQILGGARDAFINTMSSIETVVAGFEGVEPADMERLLPAIEKAGTVEGDIARSLAQFLTGFLPALKAVRVIGVTGKLLAPAVAGAVADFAAFDPNDPRMSNLLNELVPALQNPVTEYLASAPEDTASEGRLKNALEGAVLGGMSDTVFQIFRVMKFGGITRTQAQRELRTASQRAQRRVTREAERKAAATELEDIPQAITDLTDEQIATAVEEEVAAAAVRKQEGLVRTQELQAQVAQGDEEAVKEALRNASVTRAEDGSLAIRRGQRLIRFDTAQEAATEILTVRLARQEKGDLFDPQRALRSALGLSADAPLPAAIDEAVLGRVAEQRVTRQLVEVTTEGTEQAQQFISMEAAGMGAELVEQGERLRINFNMIKGADDLKQTIALVGEVMREQAHTQARGRQSIEDMLTRSRSSKFQNVVEILNLEAGQALSPEDALAVRQVWVSSANRLKTLSQQVAAGDLDATEDFLRQFVLHANIHVQATGVRAEAGRVLRIFGVEIPSTERQFLQEIGRALEDSNGVTPQRLAQMVASIPTQEQLAKFVRDAEKVTVGDAVLEYWINSLLSGPQTQVANILGNAMTTLWAIPERQLASVFSSGIGGHEALDMVYGMKQGLLDGMTMFRQSFVSGEPVFDASSKLELRQTQRSIRGQTFGQTGMLGRAIDRLGTVVTIPGRTLLAFDEFFKGLNYRMEVHAQASRQVRQEGLKGQDAATRMAALLDNPSETAVESARNFARYQTFTSELGQEGMAFERLGRATEKISEATKELPALKIILPFIRTPFNIARYAGERSPLGLFSRTVRQQLRSQGPEAGMARAKMALGTMIMGVGGLMAAEGRISGRGPTDPRLRKFKQQNDNWQPYSMKIGNRWVAYNRLEPLGSLFGMVADFTQMAGEMDEVEADRVAGMLLMTAWQNMTSKTYMRGLSEAMATLAPDNWADPKQSIRPGSRFFEQLAGTVVPTFFAQLNRAHFDSTLRETHGMMDRICSRIPGCSQTLEPRLNLWAEPIELHGGLGYDFISPLYLTMRVPDDVDRALVDLQVPLTMPARSFSLGGGEDPLELTPTEYNDLIRLQAGVGPPDAEGNPTPLQDEQGNTLPTLKAVMRAMISSRDYARADDTMKRLLLRDIIYNPSRGYRPLARALFLQQHPAVLQKMVEAQTKGGELTDEAQNELQQRILRSVIGGTP